MTTTEEDTKIKFPFDKVKNEFNVEDYAPRHTSHRLSTKRVQQVAMRVNKILKTNEKREKIYQLIVVFLPVFWVALGFVIVWAFHRKETYPGTLGLLEINFYMFLCSISFILHFFTVRVWNKSTEKKYRLIQKFLMDKNQFIMKTGYHWDIELPSTHTMDIIPPRKLNFTNLELCKDYWTIEDFSLVDDDQENFIKFAYNERENQFTYQFYTPRLTNFRMTLQEISGFFANIEEILKSNTKSFFSSWLYINSSSVGFILFTMNTLVLLLLKSQNQGNAEFLLLILLFIAYCLSLRIAANKFNENTRKKYTRIQDLLTLENGVSKESKGISWSLGELKFQKKDPISRGILIFDDLELKKEHGNDENIFYDEAFNQEDPSFEKENEEDISQRADESNVSISGYFLNNE